ncbi:hypothetical protein PanWU01x14_271680, partial [Parasponia andersonii]
MERCDCESNIGRSGSVSLVVGYEIEQSHYHGCPSVSDCYLFDQMAQRRKR